MRKIFSKILEENLILNKKNFLITWDLGFNVLDNIKENFKESINLRFNYENELNNRSVKIDGLK